MPYLTNIVPQVIEALRVGMLEAHGDIPWPTVLGTGNDVNFDPITWLRENIYFHPFDSTNRRNIGIELHIYLDDLVSHYHANHNHPHDNSVSCVIETVIPDDMDKLPAPFSDTPRADILLQWITESMERSSSNLRVEYLRGHICENEQGNRYSRVGYFGHKIDVRIELIP